MQQTNTHNFKVGDKVKVKPYSEFDFSDELYDCCQEDIKMLAGKTFEIIEIDKDGDLRLDTSFIGYRYYIHPEQAELVETSFTSTKKPRKHAELIKQWADDDSLQIQAYDEDYNAWVNVYPQWDPETQYRIKPKTVTKWKWAYNTGKTDATILTSEYFADEEELKKYRNSCIAKAMKLDWTAKEFEI